MRKLFVSGVTAIRSGIGQYGASTISLMLELPPAIHSTITTHIDDTLEQEGLAKSEEKTVSEAV